MAVNQSSAIQLNKLNPTNLNSVNKKSDAIESDFGDILKNAINDVSKLQNDANVATQKLVTGETDDIASVMTAVEKSDIALQYTMAVRNKIMDAYNEIMRMQV